MHGTCTEDDHRVSLSPVEKNQPFWHDFCYTALRPFRKIRIQTTKSHFYLHISKIFCTFAAFYKDKNND